MPSFTGEIFVKAIDSLLAYSKDHVNALVVPVVERFISHVKASDINDDSFVKNSMTRTISALRHRRGYMLPIGANTELVAHQEAVWTYAVFTAALLWHVPQRGGDEKQTTLQFMEDFLPPLGTQWLKSYSIVYETWKTALLSADKSLPVMQAILKAVNNKTVTLSKDTDFHQEVAVKPQNDLTINNANTFNFDKFFSSL